MISSAPRFRWLPFWLAGLYFAWSVFVYLWMDHAWWPLFLYHAIWPVSAIWEHWIRHIVFGLLAPNPHAVPDHIYILDDRIAGAYYILIGTLWMWFVGWVFSRLMTLIFPGQSKT